MTMKKTIWIMIAPAILLAGCDDACKDGLELKTKLQAIEQNVTRTIELPANFAEACTQFRAHDQQALTTGARYASAVADNHFSWIEHRCVLGHYRQDCSWYGDPRHPQYVCHNVYVCDLYQSKRHLRDGYEQAVELSTRLTTSAANLANGCTAHDGGESATAVQSFATAKLELNTALTHMETVLTKAGCYERPGN